MSVAATAAETSMKGGKLVFNNAKMINTIMYIIIIFYYNFFRFLQNMKV